MSEKDCWNSNGNRVYYFSSYQRCTSTNIINKQTKLTQIQIQKLQR